MQSITNNINKVSRNTNSKSHRASCYGFSSRIESGIGSRPTAFDLHYKIVYKRSLLIRTRTARVSSDGDEKVEG